jgi:hypothetical protein
LSLCKFLLLPLVHAFNLFKFFLVADQHLKCKVLNLMPSGDLVLQRSQMS